MTTSSSPHIPLLRFGRAYQSLDAAPVNDPRTGEAIASMSMANAGLIRRDLHRIPTTLRDIPCADLVAMCKRAGDLFMNADMPITDDQTQSAQQYVETLSITSGLPHNLCRQNMQKVNAVLTGMDTILRGLTRGLELSIFDNSIGEQDGVPVCYTPQTNALGVVLPSNSPGVNSIWLPSIAMKVPVVLKPGREEPWTPLRIVHALIAAGVPREAFGFYPTDHEGADAIMTRCDRAIIFGDDKTLKKYANNPAINLHGTGRSKIILGDDCADDWEQHLDIMLDSLLANGGRSCINLSCILTPRHGDAIADALAKRVAAIGPAAPDDPEAKLSACANPLFAEYIDQAITDALPGSVDVTARYRSEPRRAQAHGYNYLRPTVIRCPSFDHSLANTEYLFPFVAVTEMPQDEMLSRIGPTLALSAITRDPTLIGELLRCKHIDRLNLGAAPTCRVQWDQPHEGNLFEFLYKRRAIQQAAIA